MFVKLLFFFPPPLVALFANKGTNGYDEQTPGTTENVNVR